MYVTEIKEKQIFKRIRWQLRIFESVFYKSLIRACSFGNSLAASQNARSYVQTLDHRTLRICKKCIQKVLMLLPFILINIFSYLLSDSYMKHYYKSHKPFFKCSHHLIRQTKIIRLKFNLIAAFPFSKFQF